MDQNMVLVLTAQEAQSTATVIAKIKGELSTQQDIAICDGQGKLYVTYSGTLEEDFQTFLSLATLQIIFRSMAPLNSSYL